MSEDKTDGVNIKKELSPSIKSFGKVSSTTKQKPPSKKKTTTKCETQTQTSIMKSFGKIPKKKKKEPGFKKRKTSTRFRRMKPIETEIVKVYRYIENYIDAINCKDRKASEDSFCDNSPCYCQYSIKSTKDMEYDYNKHIIQTKINRSLLGSYGQNILSMDWYEREYDKYEQLKIDRFIKQCKFLYGLKEIIGYDMETDLKPIFDVLNCKHRVEDVKWGCYTWTFKKDNSKPRCLNPSKPYCYRMTTKKLILEAKRRIYITLLTKNGILHASKWDRIALSYDWSKISIKQQSVLNNFFVRHSKLKSKFDSIYSDWLNNYQSKIQPDDL
jgi:hypothetical protein